MAGKLRRKGKPYNPAAIVVPVRVHERKATDAQQRNREFGEIEIDDPYELGAKIVALRSFRDDPLGRLHDRRQIDEAQYLGGRAFQGDFEIAERGPQAVDPSKEFVDGGRMPEPITEKQQKAIFRLNQANRKLGADGSAIAFEILIAGKSIAKVCEGRNLVGRQWEDYFGAKFRLECLNKLAVFYGFATPENRGVDKLRAKALQTS